MQAVVRIHVVSQALDYLGSGEYSCSALYCSDDSHEYSSGVIHTPNCPDGSDEYSHGEL